MHQANSANSAVLSDGNPHRHYGTGRHWSRQAAMARIHLTPGDTVRWTPDNDIGTVTGVSPDGQAVAIRWDSTGNIEWYASSSGALSFIETLESQEEV
jgi:plastocyanin